MNEDMERYLVDTSEGECENCGEPIKLLHFEWGEANTHTDLTTVLNTILEEDEILGEPLDYDKLNIKYCRNCGVVDLHLE